MSGESKNQGLPLFSKLVFYGLNGFCFEIVFTALWFFFDPAYNYGWKLHGSNSLWSFPMYGIAIYVIEIIYKAMRDKFVFPLRMIVYIAWIYIWEYSCGYVLRMFDACPWDYTDYTTYHINGLINFDYIPLWATAVFLCEKITFKIAFSLSYHSVDSVNEKVKAH